MHIIHLHELSELFVTLIYKKKRKKKGEFVSNSDSQMFVITGLSQQTSTKTYWSDDGRRISVFSHSEKQGVYQCSKQRYFAHLRICITD